MSTATINRHRRPRWRAVLGLVVVFGSGCSFALADADPHEPLAPSPHILYSVSERSSAERSVTLLPQRLESSSSLGETSGPRLYVGGVVWFRNGNGADPFNRVALVILAASDSIQPVLHESRQLLLDIDGEFFLTHPMPDPHLYTFRPTRLGYTETVIVPIDRKLLTLMAQAERVRGRVGHWLAFDLQPEVIARLNDLLTALPSDFPSGHGRVAALPLLHVID